MRTAFAPLLYFVITGLIQIGSFSLAVISHRGGLSPTLIVLLYPLSAFILATLFNLPRSWKVVNVTVVPAAVMYTLLSLPTWILLAIAALLLLVYLPTFWTRVPYYPTSTLMYEAISKELPDGEFTFIDLGCGFGSLLMYLSEKFPQGKFYGVEISPLPYLIAKIRSLTTGGRVSISSQSIWNISLSPYRIVYAFLAPPPMPRLWEKVKADMKPGSIFLVNSFKVDAKEDRLIEVNDERRCKLYRYEIGIK